MCTHFFKQTLKWHFVDIKNDSKVFCHARMMKCMHLYLHSFNQMFTMMMIQSVLTYNFI